MFELFWVIPLWTRGQMLFETLLFNSYCHISIIHNNGFHCDIFIYAHSVFQSYLLLPSSFPLTSSDPLFSTSSPILFLVFFFFYDSRFVGRNMATLPVLYSRREHFPTRHWQCINSQGGKGLKNGSLSQDRMLTGLLWCRPWAAPVNSRVQQPCNAW